MDSKGRSIAKAITWRLMATLTTLATVWAVTGSAGWAGAVAGLDGGFKLVLYYWHERLWGQVGQRVHAVYYDNTRWTCNCDLCRQRRGAL